MVKKCGKESAGLFDFSTDEGDQSEKQSSVSESVLLTNLSKCLKEISSDKNFSNPKRNRMRKKLKIDDLSLDIGTPNGNISKIVDSCAFTPTFICSTPKAKESNELIGSKCFLKERNSSKKQNSTKNGYKTKHSSLRYADENSYIDVLGKHQLTPTNQNMSPKTFLNLKGVKEDDLCSCEDSFSVLNSPNVSKKSGRLSSYVTLTVYNTPKNIPVCDLTQ